MILLAGASVAVLASTAADAVTFTFTGSVQTFNVTQTGLYDLRALGGQGGNGPNTQQGGAGAAVYGRFALNSGDVLSIVVGGKGGNSVLFAGGGGGTFIYKDLATPLAIAGGGGGSSFKAMGGRAGGTSYTDFSPPGNGVFSGAFDGCGYSNDATNSVSGGGGGGNTCVNDDPPFFGGRGGGSTGGQAGTFSPDGFGGEGGGSSSFDRTGLNDGEGGGGGGGFFGSGSDSKSGVAGGFGGPAGFLGGGNGGFGGGGGGGGIGGYSGGAGGGGGFSGGGGGASGYAGGAGGSFLAPIGSNFCVTGVGSYYCGFDQDIFGNSYGNGLATIDLFSATGAVPEPSTWAMLITGFGGIGAMLRRRRLRTA